MSDPLKELFRQRELLLEQMAWLDREIKAAQGAQGPAKPSPLPPTPIEKTLEIPAPALKSAASSADAAAAERTAEKIMAQYQDEGKNIQSSVRRGCFMYFFAALGIVALGVLALYFFRTRH